MTTYSPIFPTGVKVRPDVEAFIVDFFRLSDTPGQHDEYVDKFTEDATFILASKASKGSKGMRLKPCINLRRC